MEVVPCGGDVNTLLLGDRWGIHYMAYCTGGIGVEGVEQLAFMILWTDRLRCVWAGWMDGQYLLMVVQSLLLVEQWKDRYMLVSKASNTPRVDAEG